MACSSCKHVFGAEEAAAAAKEEVAEVEEAAEVEMAAPAAAEEVEMAPLAAAVEAHAPAAPGVGSVEPVDDDMDPDEGPAAGLS